MLAGGSELTDAERQALKAMSIDEVGNISGPSSNNYSVIVIVF